MQATSAARTLRQFRALRRAALAVVVATATPVLALVSATAMAQEFGARPVTLVVPFSQATGIDILGRTLAPHLSTRWRVPVVVENRAGASGNIGAEAVMRAAADGTTLLVTATSLVTNAAVNKRVPYDPRTSFAPIALLGTGTMSLIVSTNTPAANVRELVDLAKKQPGRLNYASTGNGTPQHLAMELFKLETGADIVHVPYKASAGATTDVTGGHVNAMITPVHTAAPFVAGGKVRMLGVMAEERVPAMPGVPTFREQGFPNLQVDVWYAMLAPAAIQPALVARLNADVNAVLAQPDVRESLAKQGLVAQGGPPERLAALIRAESQRWPRVVEAAKITAD